MTERRRHDPVKVGSGTGCDIGRERADFGSFRASQEAIQRSRDLMVSFKVAVMKSLSLARVMAT